MSYPLTFASHFSRLLWQTLNEPADHEAQLATLRTLVSASGQETVTISTCDWHLVVNGEELPERFVGAQDLTAQLIGHSIIELIAEPAVSPLDLACVARILAREPVSGDGGKTVMAMLDRMRVSTLRVTVEQPSELPRRVALPTTARGAGIAGVMSDGDAMSLFLTGTAANRGADGEDGDGKLTPDDDSDLVRETDPETLFETFSAVSESETGSLARLFAQLDASLARRGGEGGSGAAMRHLDALVKVATQAAMEGRDEVAADVFSRLIEREASTSDDRGCWRMYGVAIRRLSSPVVLNAVAGLLVSRRENETQYMAIIERAEDAGAEALIDALVSAASLAERRVFFDALLKLNSGVRTLLFMLGDDRWYVVRNAVELLGEMRVAEADSDLIRLLDHHDDRVRSAAAAALSKIGTTTAVKGLLMAARETPDAEMRDRATGALSPSVGGHTVVGIVRALEKEEDGRVQMALLAALAQIASPEAVERLASIASANGGGLFRRKSPTPLRVAAVRALGEVPSPSATAALNALARDREKDVRGAASWILLGRRKRKGKPAPDDAA